MDKQQQFCEKIMLNLFANWNTSFAYERIYSKMIYYRRHIFTDAGHWGDALDAKLVEYRRRQQAKGESTLDSYDFPVAPEKYLTEEDIRRTVEQIISKCPYLENDFELEDNAKMLGDLLDLDSAEQILLQLSIFSTGRLQYPFEELLPYVTKMSEFDDHYRMYEKFFGLSEKETGKALDGFLFKSGLLVPHRTNKNLFQIAPEMADAFTDQNVTANSIGESLFPSSLDTDLDTSSYPHCAVEIERAEAIIQRSTKGESKGINVMFWGLPGTGKTELALALAKKHGWDLKVIGDSSKLDMAEKSRAQRLTSLKIAMKLYQSSPNTVLLFDEMEDLFKLDTNANFSKAFINRIIETTPIPIIWTTNDLVSIGSAVLRRMTYNIGFEVPPVSARKQIWESYTEKYGVNLDASVIDDLATNYDIVPSLIGNSVKIAKLANLHENTDVADIVKSLDRLVHYGVKRKFTPVAVKDTPYDMRWVNTSVNLPQLSELLTTAKPNFTLCLYGAPGTGKSEFARHLAGKLKKRVLFKRASDLVSMWVGQTEANIAACFEEARKEEMFLIIDEGDSFLRNRELAKASWEVTQVNEMLSQMENHTQPFVITTNLMDNLDQASLRRFTFKMKFDFLLPDQAKDIFQAYFNAEAPAAIANNDILTPGDFANVKKRADIIGITDAKAIYEMLVEECDMKPQAAKGKYGFM